MSNNTNQKANLETQTELVSAIASFHNLSNLSDVKKLYCYTMANGIKNINYSFVESDGYEATSFFNIPDLMKVISAHLSESKQAEAKAQLLDLIYIYKV